MSFSVTVTPAGEVAGEVAAAHSMAAQESRMHESFSFMWKIASGAIVTDCRPVPYGVGLTGGARRGSGFAMRYMGQVFNLRRVCTPPSDLSAIAAGENLVTACRHAALGFQPAAPPRRHLQSAISAWMDARGRPIKNRPQVENLPHKRAPGLAHGIALPWRPLLRQRPHGRKVGNSANVILGIRRRRPGALSQDGHSEEVFYQCAAAPEPGSRALHFGGPGAVRIASHTGGKRFCEPRDGGPRSQFLP